MDGAWPNMRRQQNQPQRPTGSQVPISSQQQSHSTMNANALANAMAGVNYPLFQNPNRTQFPTYSIQQAYGRTTGAAIPYNAAYQRYSYQNPHQSMVSTNPYASTHGPKTSASPPDSSQLWRAGMRNNSPPNNAQQSPTMGSPSGKQDSTSPPNSTQQSPKTIFINPELPPSAILAPHKMQPPSATLAHTHGPNRDGTTTSNPSEKKKLSQVKAESSSPSPTQTQAKPEPRDAKKVLPYIHEKIINGSPLSKNAKVNYTETLRHITNKFAPPNDFERMERAFGEWRTLSVAFYKNLPPEISWRFGDAWEIEGEYEERMGSIENLLSETKETETKSEQGQ